MTKEDVKMSRRVFNKVSSTRSPLESLKAEVTQDEIPRINSKRQRTPGTVKESNTIKYDSSLVGSKVKVWWPSYRRFYEGVIASFDHVKRKHKLYYDDGDVEDINLRQERWEFVDDVSVKNGDAEVEHSYHDTSSDTKHKKLCGGKSTDDGKQELGIKVNNLSPDNNNVDDAAIRPQNGKVLTNTSLSPMVKESGTALPKTASSSSSKGGEGTLHPQAIKSTLKRLSQMLDEGIHADVTIITSDGSLKAHKSILSVSSLVFHRMFREDLQEKVSTIEIKEMTSESCMALLSFLYGSLNHEALLRHRMDLLGAASKYDILDLKDVCEQSFLEDINSGNVFERLQQAWLYQLVKLKKVCFTYLLDSRKIYDVNEFFKEADRGLLADMFQELLAVLKRN